LLGLGVILALAAARDWRLWTVSRRIPPMTPDQLVAAFGSGRKRRLVAVTGVAQPGRGVALASPVNAQPCVWHRYTVHRRQMHHDASGRSRPSLLSRLVADETSREPLAVSGSTSTILVQLNGFHIDRPDRAPTRALPGLATRPFPEDLLSPDVYVHREWIIHAGTPLYVLAEAAGAAGGVVLRKPGRGPYTVSTRSPLAVRRRAFATAVLGFGLAAAAVVGAAVLALSG
jgi:hypothetical protein